MRNLKSYISRINEASETILFADLDGTLIETKSGKTFGEDKNDWKLKENVISSIYALNPLRIHIVTNQAGIAKGYLTEEDFVSKINAVISAMIKKCGCNTITFDYCPSENKEDPKRKPNPGMINDFIKKNNINISNCIMIGDASGRSGQFSDSDLKAAESAGVTYMDVDDFVKKYLK